MKGDHRGVLNIAAFEVRFAPSGDEVSYMINRPLRGETMRTGSGATRQEAAEKAAARIHSFLLESSRLSL